MRLRANLIHKSVAVHVGRRTYRILTIFLQTWNSLPFCCDLSRLGGHSADMARAYTTTTLIHSVALGFALRGTFVIYVDSSQSVFPTSPKTGVELGRSGCVACKRYICASSWSLCASTRWVASHRRSLQPSGWPLAPVWA